MTHELTPQQRRRAERRFHDAVAVPAEPRAALSDPACAIDSVVWRDQVERLQRGVRSDRSRGYEVDRRDCQRAVVSNPIGAAGNRSLTVWRPCRVG